MADWTDLLGYGLGLGTLGLGAYGTVTQGLRAGQDAARARRYDQLVAQQNALQQRAYQEALAQWRRDQASRDTANVANRTSDGQQQLFRQQA